MARSLWLSSSCTIHHQPPKIYGAATASSSGKPVGPTSFKFPLASKIMVRNLSYSTTESCLEKEFSKFGKIAEVKLVKDEVRNKSKGYAFVQYSSQEAALQALESMDQKYVDGRLVYVELAKPDRHSGGYPKTSGPPTDQNLFCQDEKEERQLDS